MDALVFEFMGLAMLGLCIAALVVPSPRPLPGTSATTNPGFETKVSKPPAAPR